MWRRSAARLVVVLAAAACGLAEAEATTTVVDLPTRGVTQRFLYVRPDAPVANIVFLPGANGILGIDNDGSMPTLAGRCAPFVRNHDAFASRGFALALVDQASDRKVRQFEDVREVVRYMRGRDNVPTWVVGGSASTMAALDFAIEFPLDEPLGVVIFSPWKPDASRAPLVKRPTLIVYHREDAISAPFVNDLFDALTAAPIRERIGLAGGTMTDECGGHHLFRGIDEELVDAIAGFIVTHKAFPPPRGTR
jgi:pimeloyl-ACP methyl ester carboxylesterase